MQCCPSPAVTGGQRKQGECHILRFEDKLIDKKQILFIVNDEETRCHRTSRFSNSLFVTQVAESQEREQWNVVPLPCQYCTTVSVSPFFRVTSSAPTMLSTEDIQNKQYLRLLLSGVIHDSPQV